MPEFIKKPVVVEARRWDGSEESQREIVNWAEGWVSGWFYFLEVLTLHGHTRADVGDWIIRGPSGDFWPCKPDIFEESYGEAVIEPTNPARDLIYEGIEAFRLTREYVGEELLPDTPGWSWADWTQKAKDFLYG